MDGFAGILALGPKIVAIDVIVSEPKRTMMRMIMLLVWRAFHGPVARHGNVARARERVTVRAGNVFEKVFGEKFAVKLDPEPIRQLGDLNALFLIRGGRLLGGERERESGGGQG